MGRLLGADAPKTMDEVRLTLSLPRVINFKFLLQPHQKYFITEYEELGFSWLTQMKDDYTTNSHYLTLYIYLWKVWENVLLGLISWNEVRKKFLYLMTLAVKPGTKRGVVPERTPLPDSSARETPFFRCSRILRRLLITGWYPFEVFVYKCHPIIRSLLWRCWDQGADIGPWRVSVPWWRPWLRWKF